ncbi:hypothetical protein B6V00_04465 [ANME-1 cluster archaeon ex4572_4]|nr:MAG: hypothetical protein B6V00_04465 [ANME-1 cluster archaeon ex4572_4]
MTKVKRRGEAGRKAKTRPTREVLEEHKEVLKTVALFLALCFALNFAYFKIAGDQRVPREVTAFLVALLLNIIGLNAAANGSFVTVGGRVGDATVNIIGECTGIFSIIVYCSVVLAYPTGLKQKAVGLLGVPVLYGITLVRLSSTALVGAFVPSLLDLFHTYLWQVFLIFFVVLLFLIWRDKVVEKNEK